MNLLEMKRRLDSMPQPKIHEVLADFEAHLIALSRRQKFAICPRKRAYSPAARAAANAPANRTSRRAAA